MITPLSQKNVHDTLPSLYPYLERIIEKKVNKVALNVFEYVVDFFCRYCYSSYQQHLTFRLEELSLDPQDEEGEPDTTTSDSVATAQKIHYFMDGAPLYDRTATQRAEIKTRSFVDLITKETTFQQDQIIIDGKPVHFSSNPANDLLFGKQYNTEEVFVSDLKECPELVMIYEREVSGSLKAWCVNTTQPTKKIIQGGQLNLTQSEIFIANEMTSQPAPQPIITQFGG